MLVCARPDRNDLACAAGRLKGTCPWAAVTSGNGYHDACIDCVVEPNRQQVVVTMEAASQRKIENIHAVFECRLNRVEDVLATCTVTALINVVGEDVVVPQLGTRGYSGHVIDADAVDDSSLASHAGGDPGGVGPVSLDCLCIEALLLRLVEEDFCNNHFWSDVPAVLIGVVGIAIFRIALGEPRGVAEPGWIEERVRLLDA